MKRTVQMKTVIVSEYVQQPNKTWKLQEKGQAELLCFGINHEQYDNSTGILPQR